MHKFNINPTSDYKICEVFVNDKLIAINTLSGKGTIISDFKAVGFILERYANSQDIASGILVCLKNHRKVNRLEDSELYKNVTSLHKQWVNDLISFGNFKNEISVFKPLYRITFIEHDGFIKAEPSSQVAIKAWTTKGIPEEMNFYCKSDEKEIGEIFELALSKCKSKFKV